MTKTHNCYSFELTNIKGTMKSDSRGMNRLTSGVPQIGSKIFARILDSLFFEQHARFCCHKHKGFLIERSRALSRVLKNYNINNAQLMEVCDIYCDAHPGCCTISPKSKDSNDRNKAARVYYALPSYDRGTTRPSTSRLVSNTKKRNASTDELSRKRSKPLLESSAGPSSGSAPSTSSKPPKTATSGVAKSATFVHGNENVFDKQFASSAPPHPSKQSTQSPPHIRRPSMDQVVNGKGKVVDMGRQSDQHDYTYDSALSEIVNSSEFNAKASVEKSLEYKKFISSLGHFSTIKQNNQGAQALASPPPQHIQRTPQHSHTAEVLKQTQQIQRLNPPSKLKDASMKQSYHAMAMENSRKAKKKVIDTTTPQGILNAADDSTNLAINPPVITKNHLFVLNSSATNVPDNYSLFDIVKQARCVMAQALKDKQPHILQPHLFSYLSAHLSIDEQDQIFADGWHSYIYDDLFGVE